VALDTPPTFGGTRESGPGSVATAVFAVPAAKPPTATIQLVAANDIFTPQPVGQGVAPAVITTQEPALAPATAVSVPRASLGFVTMDEQVSEPVYIQRIAPAPLAGGTPIQTVPTVPGSYFPAPPAARLGQVTTTTEWQEPGSFQPVPAGVVQSQPVPAVTTTSQPVHYPRGAPTTVRRSFVDLTAAPCFAHAPDYSWIIGRVEYSSITKEWRLRYASVDEVDRFGGRVALIENQHVGYLADGMYVQVRGHLVNPEEASNRSTFYRIEWYRVVDNPNEVQTPPPAADVTQTSAGPKQ
jgi:hypothetical protein